MSSILKKILNIKKMVKIRKFIYSRSVNLNNIYDLSKIKIYGILKIKLERGFYDEILGRLSK